MFASLYFDVTEAGQITDAALTIGGPPSQSRMLEEDGAPSPHLSTSRDIAARTPRQRKMKGSGIESWGTEL